MAAARAPGESAFGPASAPLQRAVLRACRADVEAFKPGNVAIGAPAHRMSADDFLRSAVVIAAPLADAHIPLGGRIEAAVAATLAAVGCNTNLGIVLLLAPLADAALCAAAAGEPPGAWRRHLPMVLTGTSVADGAAVARAIVRAHPAGLGAAPEADVTAAAPGFKQAFHHTLLEAMALAAHRDQIARQYVTGFAAVLDMAASLQALRQAGATREDAVTAIFLRQLAAESDTHIARKHGRQAALAASREAAAAVAESVAPPHWSATHVRRLTELHDRFLQHGINPGTTADLTVAAVFSAELDAMQNF
ncbi:MAG: triphosphoribosyl-dephospho-CoA synthase [Rhodocyclaceae bacterium]|nr:triphosphoribosyl-dephospho-CoA synthase [Rhodocyclaceae bacterium]